METGKHVRKGISFGARRALASILTVTAIAILLLLLIRYTLL